MSQPTSASAKPGLLDRLVDLFRSKPAEEVARELEDALGSSEGVKDDSLEPRPRPPDDSQALYKGVSL